MIFRKDKQALEEEMRGMKFVTKFACMWCYFHDKNPSSQLMELQGRVFTTTGFLYGDLSLSR